MKWFQIQEQRILPFANKLDAYRYAIERNLSVKLIKPISLRPMTTRACLTLFTHILHHVNTGHSLQSALMQQNHLQYGAELRRHVLAIQSLLSEGHHVAKALTVFLPQNIKHLAGSIPVEGTEEAKIAALRVAHSILQSQQALTNKLLKSLTYPHLVIQSSLLLAMVNAVLSKQSIIMLGITWGLISLLQLAISVWVYRGHAYPALSRLLVSFRSNNSLLILVALLQSGDPLQGAIEKLLENSSKQDKLALHRCLLLLQAGTPVPQALPKHWFNQQIQTQLEQVYATGDLVTPLTMAAQSWDEINQRILNLVSKAFPILGIVIAALFVTQTLMALYAPLMEVNTLGF
ncbi:Bacterial type II secretion system protein F domain protein [Marinomonas aquimarina]|uniref:Bacterial type II secretion system protein F domain protein n=1 Tax=Marinomonas aquimarina TaxID=295068 RepID=A0A1A8TFE7_9GAMM|nr:type II secretion system F family protein [Marinomonas aquimarina]SBS31242.1 Bacterial type II secretion system protein F domain protein [Marinomonas aquimarina]